MKLDELADRIRNYNPYAHGAPAHAPPSSSTSSAFSFFGFKSSPNNSSPTPAPSQGTSNFPKGLYLYGDVGSGKTMYITPSLSTLLSLSPFSLLAIYMGVNYYLLSSYNSSRILFFFCIRTLLCFNSSVYRMMDLFLEAISAHASPLEKQALKKNRVHFHSFMAETHKRTP